MDPEKVNLRKYGSPPHQLILIHGGPGAAGQLSPLARKLSAKIGLIEALQTRDTINGLIEEIHDIIMGHARKPVIMLGHSWGAWLSLLYGKRYPADIKMYILVACPPFENESARSIMQTRLERLDNNKTEYLHKLLLDIENSSENPKDETFSEIATILRLADAYEHDDPAPNGSAYSFELYDAIWKEAERLRSNGELLRQASNINCPVLAIHGDHDPHPAEAVSIPLKNSLKDFRFKLLKKCGHEPWSERYAKVAFFNLLYKEIQ